MAYINLQTDTFMNASGLRFNSLLENEIPSRASARALGIDYGGEGIMRNASGIDEPHRPGRDYSGFMNPLPWLVFSGTDSDGTPCGQQTRFSRTACEAPGTRGTAKGGQFTNASGRDADGTPCGSRTAGYGTACTPYAYGTAQGGQMMNAAGTQFSRPPDDWPWGTAKGGDIYRNLTERHHLKPQKRTESPTNLNWGPVLGRSSTHPGASAQSGQLNSTELDGTPCGQQNSASRTACTGREYGRAKGGQFTNVLHRNAAGNGYEWETFPPGGGRARAINQGELLPPSTRGSTRMIDSDTDPWPPRAYRGYDGDDYSNLTERHHLKPQKRTDPDGTPCGQQNKFSITACTIDSYGKAQGGSIVRGSSRGYDTEYLRNATGGVVQGEQAVQGEQIEEDLALPYQTPPPPPPPLTSFQQRMNAFGCNGLNSRRAVLQSKLNNLQSAGTNPQWILQLQHKLNYIDNQLQIKGC